MLTAPSRLCKNVKVVMIVKEIKYWVGSQPLFLERNSCDVLLHGPIYLGIEMTLTISCGYERNIFKVPLDSHKLALKKRKSRGNKHFFIIKTCLQKQGNRFSYFTFYSLWLSKI